MRFFIRSLVFSLVLTSLQAWADCDLGKTPTSTSDAMRLLALNSQFGCLGNKDVDKNLLTQEIEQLTPIQGVIKNGEKDDRAVKDELEGVRQSLTALKGYASTRSKIEPDRSDWENLALEIERIAELVAKLPIDQSLTTYPSNVDHAFTPKWKFILESNTDDNLPIDFNSKKVYPFRPITQCSPTGCNEYSNRLDLARVINLMYGLQSYATRDSLRKRVVVADRELMRWKNYRSDALHQYPWEVELNGWLMSLDDNICSKNSNAARIGFCSVPRSQLIAMHPDVGLRWANGVSSSSDLKPAFVIETIGYYGWRWESDDSAVMKNRLGASLAAVYSKELPGGSRWAYGPMFHVGDFNFALTKAHGENWGITVNILLADRILEKQHQVEELKKIIK